MATITNTLARSAPILAADVEAEAYKAFAGTTPVQTAIKSLLEALPGRPGGAGYKYIVHVTELDEATRGPIKTCAGGLWDEQTDGALTVSVAPRHLIVTVIWIKQ